MSFTERNTHEAISLATLWAEKTKHRDSLEPVRGKEVSRFKYVSFVLIIKKSFTHTQIIYKRYMEKDCITPQKALLDSLYSLFTLMLPCFIAIQNTTLHSWLYHASVGEKDQWHLAWRFHLISRCHEQVYFRTLCVANTRCIISLTLPELEPYDHIFAKCINNAQQKMQIWSWRAILIYQEHLFLENGMWGYFWISLAMSFFVFERHLMCFFFPNG